MWRVELNNDDDKKCGYKILKFKRGELKNNNKYFKIFVVFYLNNFFFSFLYIIRALKGGILLLIII